jgi:RNA polymerase sigma-70 factor (ECF subfamily)
LRALPGESAEELENRIGTGLMALYRDTRDARVFEALYDFSRKGVLAWIQGLIGRELQQLDPRELLQDTFVNVYRYPGAFREEHDGSFRVWVRTIAGNAVRRSCANHSRSSGREQDLVEIADRSRGPDEAIESAEQLRRLRGAWILFLCHYARAWSELSPRDRRTLHLVEVEGLSYEEVGRILDVGRSNLKMIVFRSRRRIARRMRTAMGRAVEPRCERDVA